MRLLQIEAWVSSTTPMLIHRATEEALSGKTRSNNPRGEENPREVCERTVYRLAETGQLAVPGAAFSRMLREAGGAHKAKGSRKSVKYIVPAAVIVLDELCGVFLEDRHTPVTDFEVDSRPVTIPATKGRVMRHRARLNAWAIGVRLRINTEILEESMVRQLMVDGLQQIGIGDFRPEKGGPFGTAHLVAWNIVSEAAPLTLSEARNTRPRVIAAE